MSLSLGKLRLGRKPPRDPEGRMTLYEHLAELRSRLLTAVIAIVLGMVVALFFYDPAWTEYGLYNLLVNPLRAAQAQLLEQNPNVDVMLNFQSVTAPFMMMIQVSLVAGLVATSPVWLYQIWAFIVPGLHQSEKRWSRVFVGVAAPLFITGILVAYYVMPKGFEVLLGFTPASAAGESANIIPIDEFLSLMLRLFLVFGIGFLFPVFVVLLNLVGVLSARRLAKWRPWFIFAIFAFGAIATPSLDPITMLFLAIPMSLLHIVSEIIARLIERSRRKRMNEEDPDLVVFGDD